MIYSDDDMLRLDSWLVPLSVSMPELVRIGIISEVPPIFTFFSTPVINLDFELFRLTLLGERTSFVFAFFIFLLYEFAGSFEDDLD